MSWGRRGDTEPSTAIAATRRLMTALDDLNAVLIQARDLYDDERRDDDRRRP